MVTNSAPANEIKNDGETPLVTVIVNCLNEENYVGEALDSVMRQTYKAWEIVFWDNASTDRSGEIATSYGDKVRYFRSESTLPLGQARNLAFKQAQGKYIAILDADDAWLPDKLERQVQLFESDAGLGLVFCDVICFDDTGDRYRLFKLAKPHRGKIFGHLLTSNFIFSSAMVFRKEALASLDHVFDETYFKATDFELSRRLAYHYPFDYVDEPLSRIRTTERDLKSWQKPLAPNEVELKAALDGLVAEFPEVEHHYAAELKSIYRQTDFMFALTEWRNGHASTARHYLAQHLTHKQFAFIYLCTLLMPYSFYNRLKNTFRGLITRRV